MIRLKHALISPLVLGLSLSGLAAQSNNKSNPSDVSGSAIAGRVIAQGKPLQGALITLWHQPLAEPIKSNVAMSGRTDVDGNYELTQVPPGNYFIASTAAGFVTGKENQIFDNLRSVVVVGKAGIERVNFEMVPEGVIKGSVTDADGKAVARAPITIVPESVSPAGAGPPSYTRDLRTDDLGKYHVSGLPAGRYRIAAGYEPVTTATIFGRVGYKRVFYPDAKDEANARVIEIATGSVVTDVDINLGRPVGTFSVSARIIDSKDGKPVENLDYALVVFLNGKRIGGATTRNRSNSRGEITIANVPAGEYSIRVPGASGIVPAGEVPPAPNIFGESQHFEVTDKDVGEIEIRVVRAATVSGFVVIEGAAGMDILARVPEMHIVAMVLPKPGGANPMARTNIKPDGSFIFTGLMPGKLQFGFDAPRIGGPLPLRLVRTERDGVRLDSDPEIEAGDQIAGLRVVLGYANSSIHGIVKLDNGPLPPGIAARASVLQYGKVVDGKPVDARGNFLLQQLSGGEYTLAVSAHGGDNRYWRVEKQITISDDKVSELTMELNSTKATPAQPFAPVVPR